LSTSGFVGENLYLSIIVVTLPHERLEDSVERVVMKKIAFDVDSHISHLGDQFEVFLNLANDFLPLS
jgi:hypothetical protein